MDNQTERQTDRETDKLKGGQTDRQKEWQIEKREPDIYREMVERNG